MHLQIRTVPARSPANLADFLTVLFDNGINIESAGGHDIETGGVFLCSVAHGEEDHTMAVLEGAGYKPHLVEVDTCAIDNQPGQLLDCVRMVSEKNQLLGRAIRDIAVGVPDANNRVQVQIYSDVP